MKCLPIHSSFFGGGSSLSLLGWAKDQWILVIFLKDQLLDSFILYIIFIVSISLTPALIFIISCCLMDLFHLFLLLKLLSCIIKWCSCAFQIFYFWNYNMMVSFHSAVSFFHNLPHTSTFCLKFVTLSPLLAVTYIHACVYT